MHPAEDRRAAQNLTRLIVDIAGRQPRTTSQQAGPPHRPAGASDASQGFYLDGVNGCTLDGPATLR